MPAPSPRTYPSAFAENVLQRPSALSIPALLKQMCPAGITIVFTPPDVFTYNATLSVTNSAGSAATLSLSGTGLNN